MKFLVLIEGVPGGPPVPPEQMLPLIKETWAWARRMRESRKVEAQYALADHAGGLTGGFGIVNYESAEQMSEDLAAFPMAGLATFKVYPLAAPEVVEKLIEAATAQLAKK